MLMVIKTPREPSSPPLSTLGISQTSGSVCNVTTAERTIEVQPDKAQPSGEQSQSNYSREHQVKTPIIL